MNGPDETRRELEAARERIAALSAAILRTSASLDLATVLGEAVDTARALTSARYGIITTVDEAGEVREFGIECPLLVTDPGLAAMSMGTDALSHDLEAWCSPVFHPMAQGIALEGMRLVKEWPPAACGNGTEPARPGASARPGLPSRNRALSSSRTPCSGAASSSPGEA